MEDYIPASNMHATSTAFSTWFYYDVRSSTVCEYKGQYTSNFSHHSQSVIYLYNDE
jgi:hypothetical protein